jgi:hypothetical protein
MVIHTDLASRASSATSCGTGAAASRSIEVPAVEAEEQAVVVMLVLDVPGLQVLVQVVAQRTGFQWEEEMYASD